MTDTADRRRRAPGMTPDRRRAMIVQVALPLLVTHGATLTTAQVARAAGIGEATVVRAFANKEALLDACVVELAAIPLTQPLADRLAGLFLALPMPARAPLAVPAVDRRPAATATSPRYTPTTSSPSTSSACPTRRDTTSTSTWTQTPSTRSGPGWATVACRTGNDPRTPDNGRENHPLCARGLFFRDDSGNLYEVMSPA